MQPSVAKTVARRATIGCTSSDECRSPRAAPPRQSLEPTVRRRGKTRARPELTQDLLRKTAPKAIGQPAATTRPEGGSSLKHLATALAAALMLATVGSVGSAEAHLHQHQGIGPHT